MGALVGVAAALFVVVFIGGAVTCEQAVLRYLLAREGAVPWPYRPFLDHAVSCLFLRKVGDGYIFVHRELLDYFASVDSHGGARDEIAQLVR
jgi:hypothetical protein